MSHFRHQFAIFPSSYGEIGGLPEGWLNKEIGNWQLAHCPDLPVTSPDDSAKLTLGWPVALPDHDLPGGRFLQITLHGDLLTLTPDAGGTLACLISTKSHCAASTPELVESLFSPTPSPIATELAALKASTGTWFPAGLSQWDTWEVLLPNHHLHLGQGSPQLRTWPTAPLQLASKPQALANQITSHLRNHLAGLADLAPLEITLTGGRDSRMLLAASRSLAPDCLYSVNTPPPGQHMPDVEVSATLAEVLALNHTDNTPRDPARILALGYGGEIARGHLWPQDLQSNDAVPLASLQEKMGFDSPPSPVSQSLHHWHSHLPHLPAHTIYDLLYWEQRMATTMCYQLYEEDNAGSYFPACPLATREILSATLQLPAEFRSTWKLGDHIVETSWPEANLVPYQKLYFTGREKLKTWFKITTCYLISPSIRQALRSPRFKKILHHSSRPHS